MSNELIIPEGLSKKKRKIFKRNFYRQQQLGQIKKNRIKRYSLILSVCFPILAGGYLIFRQINKPLPGLFVPSQGNKHLQNISEAHEAYNSLPPTSGSHLGSKANWGITATPIPDELQIHNLEDGGVMVQYNCTSGNDTATEATPSAQEQDACQRLIDQLANIVEKYPDKVVLAPYPRLDSRIALTAWTRIDKFGDFDESRIVMFIEAFRGIDHHKD